MTDEAENHLITLEVLNTAGERLRLLGTPASGQAGTEVAKAFKYRRWFQPEGSPGDDTKEVLYAALTHLFCWGGGTGATLLVDAADVEALLRSRLFTRV